MSYLVFLNCCVCWHVLFNVKCCRPLNRNKWQSLRVLVLLLILLVVPRCYGCL
jgi:hypothetical protein